MRIKIDYGIDLGTTNSSIARMENGSPIIKKSTTGSTQTDTTPSCVSFNKKQNCFVGNKAYRILNSERLSAYVKKDPSIINTFEEFKRTMGTDELYECANMERSYSSDELSSEVLKTLKGYIHDEDIRSVVITVPAKFQGYQKDATIKAAELAGFEHCILLQEPIAASMAYGIDAKQVAGEWLVFDFGGGTFDVALMRANEGIMKVVDTEGDNRLGGKNIDYTIVDQLIMPYIEKKYTLDQTFSSENNMMLLRKAVKRYAEDLKIALSPKENTQYNILTDDPIGEDDNGNDVELDITISKDEFKKVVTPIFQHAIDLTNKLLVKNKISGDDLTTVLLIGGPSYSDILRDMIREQLSTNIDISIDPMTAVGKGASLFASTKDLPQELKTSDKSNVQLKLSYQSDTVETNEKVGVRILRDETSDIIPSKLYIEINRNDKGWASGKVELKDDSEILDIVLEPGRSNGFSIRLLDEQGTVLPCEPCSFSIIQGFKVASATLPFDICIDAYEISAGEQHLTSLKGLRKNQPLPAKGTGIYQTQNDIRPGNKSDRLRIPVYYGEEKTKSYHKNDLRGEVIITGEDIPGLLPKGSDVELTIEVDESEKIKVTACFPYLDDEIIDDVIETSNRKTVSKEFLERELSKADRSLENLIEEYPNFDPIKAEEIKIELSELKNLLDRGGLESDTRDQIFDNMRDLLRDIDNLKTEGEWPKIVEELKEALTRLELTNEQFGDDNTSNVVKQLNDQVSVVIERQDIKMAKDLIKQIASIDFALVDQGAGVALEISFIKGFEDEFDMHEWKNRSQARNLINDAKRIINSNRASKESLRPIVSELFQLLPHAKQGMLNKSDDDILIK